MLRDSGEDPDVAAADRQGGLRSALRLILEEILGVSDLRDSDNFFAKGGTSVTAARCVARIRRDLGVDVRLADVFETTSLADLMSRLETSQSLGPGAPYFAVATTGYATRPSIRQEQLLGLIRHAPQMGIHRPMAVVASLSSSLDVRRLEKSIRQLAVRHDILRTRFSLEGGHWVAEVPPASHLALPVEVVDARNWDAERMADDRSRRISSAFDHGGGLSVWYYRLPETRDQLLIVVSHLLSDGYSVPIILRDLSLLYRGDAGRLPPLDTGYYDFGRAQRKAIRDGSLDKSLQYWARQTVQYGCWPKVTLPTLRSRTDDQPVAAVRQSALVPVATAEEFVRRCGKVGVGSYAGYLAAASAAVQSVGGPQGDAFGFLVMLAGRSWPGTSDLVGFFSDYATLGLGLVPSQFGETANHVQRRVAETLRHDVIPRAEVVRRYGTPDEQTSFPRKTWILFEDAYELSAIQFDFGDAVLSGAEAITGFGRFRRYPGLQLVVRSAEDKTIRLECEYGAGECDPGVVQELVSAWRARVFAVVEGDT